MKYVKGRPRPYENLSVRSGRQRNFGSPLKKSKQADPGVVDAPNIAAQLRLFKRDEIAAALAGKLRFVLKPWHCFPMVTAESGAGRTDVSVVANCERPVRQDAVRAVAVSGFAELTCELSPKNFSIPRRAIAFDEPSGARNSMGFGGIVTDTDRHVQVEGAYYYGAGRFQRVMHGGTQIIGVAVY